MTRRAAGRRAARPDPGGGFYSALLTDEELRLLGEAAQGEDLSAEIAVLRILIRRAVESGVDLEVVSRGVSRLAQAERVQRLLVGDAGRSLDEALGRVLEEIASEVAPG